MTWLCLFLLTLASTSPRDELPGEPLPAGGSVAARLEVGQVIVHPFVAVGEGPITLLVDSQDLDPRLRVLDAEGNEIGDDDNGGIGENARLVVTLSAGTTYELSVSAAKGPHQFGEYTLAVRSGDAPLPQGAELLEARIAYWKSRADRLLAREFFTEGAKARNQEAGWRYRRGQFAEALAGWEQVREIGEQHGDERLRALALTNLGLVCSRVGRLDEARAYLEEHLEYAKAHDDVAGAAKDHGILADLWLRMGRPDRAREHCELALPLFEKVGDRVSMARVLGQFSEMELWAGRTDDAEEKARRQLQVFEELRHPRGMALAHERLLRIGLIRADLSQAVSHGEEALTLYRRAGERASEGRVLGDLSSLQSQQGNYAAAEERLAEALSIFEAAGMKDELAVGLHNLASLQRVRFRILAARETQRRALELARQSGILRTEANILLSLGMTETFLGRARSALSRVEKALAMLREAEDSLGIAQALRALAIVHYDLGDLEASLRSFEELERHAVESGDRVNEAIALLNCGEVSQELGKADAARDFFTRAQVRVDGQETSAVRLWILASVAIHHANLGEVEEAQRAATRSLELNVDRTDPRSARGALLALTLVGLKTGDLDLARSSIREARPLLRPAYLPAGEREAETWVRGEFAEWGEVIQDLVFLRLGSLGAEADPERAQSILAEGFEEAGTWKGRSLLGGILENRRGGRSPEAIRLRQELRDCQARLDDALSRLAEKIREGAAPEELEARRGRVAALRAERSRREEALARALPERSALELPRGVAARSLAEEVLEDGDLLVEYVEGHRDLYAYVVDREGIRGLHRLGERAALAKEVDGYLRLVSDPRGLGGVEEIASRGTALFGRILAPLLEAPERVRRIIVVPSGFVSRLPVEALVLGEREKEGAKDFSRLQFVLDRYEVVYAPSSPVLAELHRHRRPGRSEGPLLILADPIYPSELGDADSASRPTAEPELSRLEKSRQEALAIAKLVDAGPKRSGPVLDELRGRRSGRHESDRLRLLLGAEASPEVLAGDLDGFAILHFACHASLDPTVSRHSALALSWTPERDGRVSLGDVVELSLNAELVVLSACDTAAGAYRQGEGVESLASAFLYAGADRVIASLWPVSDAAAAHTMEAFYRSYLLEKRSSSRALLEARRSLRGSTGDLSLRGAGRLVSAKGELPAGHPFFWAPFVIVAAPEGG